MPKRLEQLLGDASGGFAAMLVALPSAIAFGIIIYAPLGQAYSSKGALAGLIGAFVVGFIAAMAGGTQRLISAPCAPAAAVLSAYVICIIGNGHQGQDIASIPAMILVIVILAGLIQFVIGIIGGGRFIKYIPYSVVAGYLSGVGLLIILGQLPKLFSIGNGMTLLQGLSSPSVWRWNGLFVGMSTIVAMLVSLRWLKRIPSTIVALLAGIATYWIMARYYPEMTNLKDNAMIVGSISGGIDSYASIIADTWKGIFNIPLDAMIEILIAAGTLSVLLSIDTLKTCVVLDALTRTRHDSNRELIGQGLANIAAAVSCGIPGAGTMGATMVNLGSGARSRLSGILAGLFSLLVFLFLTGLIAWVPLPALAGILIVIGIRMIDVKNFSLLRHKSTLFDFAVYVTVVITAVAFNLIAAAGMGILLSIFIFLRDQVRQPVVRRKAFGNQLFSKKRRLPFEMDILDTKGSQILVLELQGPLFFGTADQLMTELDQYLPVCKFIILDMRRVHAVDYTAVHRLDQIEQSLGERGGLLIFTSVPVNLPSGQNVQGYLGHLGLSPEGRHIRYFNNLDAGIQWAEEQILEEDENTAREQDLPLDLSEFSIFSGIDPLMIEKLGSSMTVKEYQSREIIFSRGDRGRELFFIRKGSVRIELPLADGMKEHLATFGKGDFFGEMAFLVKGGRSADAVADDRVYLYIISRDFFDQMTSTDPRLGEIVFQRIASALTERLRQTDVMIKTLAES